MRFLIFYSLGLIATTLMSQSQLTFEKTTHDFGQIKEADSSAEFSFSFVNTGDVPAKIINVKTSCGCTTPYWTKEEILPGDSGVVTALYNAVNRPGAFSKSLIVSSNAIDPAVSLFITGSVLPKPRTVEADLPTKLGAMRIKYRSFNMGRMTNEKSTTRDFEVFNDSDSSFIFLLDEMIHSENVKLEFVPATLLTKEKGLIRITYDSSKEELGYITSQVTIRTSEPIDSIKTLNIVSTIEEYFPPMTEAEMELAPKLTFLKKPLDLGKVMKDSLATAELILINEGKEDLIIRLLKPNCDCVVTSMEKDTLVSGEQVKMIIVFDSKGRKGRQFKSVSVFSNDPIQPSQMIQIKASIIE